jgi:hypothetical protein
LVLAGALLLASLLGSLGTAAGGAENALILEEAFICKDVINRTPVGAAETFPPGVPKLYCFTRVVGAREPTRITHIWYYGNREMSRVNLPVLASDWRTYSFLTFHQEWPGRWSVAVVSPPSVILKVLNFTVEWAESSKVKE